jgi:hypothetical protein
VAKIALLAVVAVLAVAAAGCGSSSRSLPETMRAAGCTYRDVPPLPPKHAGLNGYHEDVPTLATTPKWSTFPPSAGAHYRLWAVWGFYRRPLKPAQVVHNEEHGGVALWWGPQVPAATVDELQRFYDEQTTGVIGTPIDGLGNRIALTAWTADPTFKGDLGMSYLSGRYGMGHIAVCPQFDEKAFRAFRDAYRGKSPQGFPLSADAKGCGPETACR